MKKRRAAIGVAAVALPILLALAAYFVSARSLATTTQAVRAPSSKIGRPRTPPPSPAPAESRGSGGDVSGNCDELEHQNDAACMTPSGAGGSVDSTSGSGGSGDSGSTGGSGSDDSGSSGPGGSGSDD